MSLFLTLSNVSFEYSGSPRPALSDVSVTVSEGWTGVIGNNGTGKSTFLQLVAGGLEGYTGSITPAPRSAGAIYCAQPTDALPSDAQEFSVDYESDAVLLRSLLGVDEEWAWRFETLSHGERKRLQVATALWRNPAILAIDEPTNHVDAPTRDAIKRALMQYQGIGLLVSHDRKLLDALVSHCFFLGSEGRGGVMRPGTYTQAREQSELERKATATERKNAKAELGRLEAEAIRRAQEAGKADGKRSARNVDPKDTDTKGRIKLAIYTGKDGQAGRLSAQMDSKMASARARVDEAFVEKSYSGDVWLAAHPSRRKTLAVIEETHIAMGTDRALCVPQLYIGNTDHIGIVGPNGAGKSTLIRHLLGVLDEGPKTMGTGERVLYLPQETTVADGVKILERVRELPPEMLGQVLSIVAQLNSSPKRILAGEGLSPGELRKLMLAVGILENPQIIIMDEPTNHLDIGSIEALERMLAECPCALILVSHDNAFLNAATDIRWEIEPKFDEGLKGEACVTVHLQHGKRRT